MEERALLGIISFELFAIKNPLELGHRVKSQKELSRVQFETLSSKASLQFISFLP